MSNTLSKHQITVDEYYQMERDGILTPQDRVELIEGEIIPMSPIGNPHKGCVMFLTQFFSHHLGNRAIVSVQNSIRLDNYSEPQPDLVLLKPRSDYYRKDYPKQTDIYLIIEVADTTVQYDRNVKIPLYARFGILEVWLVNLSENRIEVYRDPSPQGYKIVLIFQANQAFSPLAFPEVVLTAKEILG